MTNAEAPAPDERDAENVRRMLDSIRAQIALVRSDLATEEAQTLGEVMVELERVVRLAHEHSTEFSRLGADLLLRKFEDAIQSLTHHQTESQQQLRRHYSKMLIACVVAICLSAIAFATSIGSAWLIYRTAGASKEIIDTTKRLINLIEVPDAAPERIR